MDVTIAQWQISIHRETPHQQPATGTSDLERSARRAEALREVARQREEAQAHYLLRTGR